ncbi:uncharacterized protein [Mytilus edulis]|uniref:uncharacterized protein n=1 Tax=Mytilus edulis TaxID=6550 RepID=UPI0039EF064D
MPYLSKTATKELHVFSDASEKAIAAVAYLRTTDSSGEPNIGFILGKAKVAPTSGHTIPRLELSAAVLAVEITQTIVNNLDLHIDTVKFYTDSKVVLGYISNETRRFFIYVANRVEKIRKFSSPSQWNYVPTNRNPADSGTRSVPAHEIHLTHWSEQIHKRNPIANLNPFLDERGLLRAGGRIAKSDLNLREKKPLIVPGRHHIAILLVRHYHDKIKHQGRHFTYGAIRSAGFWIIGAKRLISSLIHKCVTCRKLRDKTECQIMSDLPEDRLEPSPPFTNVGIDTFGPWTIVSRKTRGGYANSKTLGNSFHMLSD